jgi:hypothetical protein
MRYERGCVFLEGDRILTPEQRELVMLLSTFIFIRKAKKKEWRKSVVMKTFNDHGSKRGNKARPRGRRGIEIRR